MGLLYLYLLGVWVGHKSSAGTEISVLPAHSLVAIPTPASSQLEVRCSVSGGSVQCFRRKLFVQELQETTLG